MKPREDLTGKKFGKLTVIKRDGSNSFSKRMWLCSCECGNTTRASTGILHNKEKMSCGRCLCERTANGRPVVDPIKKVWRGMKDRCYNKNRKGYRLYGGRGIKVCDEWLLNFESFKFWAESSGYDSGLSIDRINNDGNYEPSNCRWATWVTQGNNRSSNRIMIVDGERMTVAECARIHDIKRSTLYGRLNRKNMSDSDAANMPVIVYNYNKTKWKQKSS